jgi:hypothetical protein
MNQLQEITIGCPYCGEAITILADASAGKQNYIEDCQVCCRPMDIHVNVSTLGDCEVEARDENS